MGKLFTDSGNWKHSARVNYSFDEWFRYSYGYLKAAEIIGNDLIEKSNDRDFLIYPLIFLYRHYLEVVLKDMIVVTNELLGNHEFIPKGGHDLMRLWDDSQKTLDEYYVDYPKPTKSIENKIKELYNFDKKSDGFRYPIDKSGDKNLETLKEINYETFINEFEEVKVYMEGMTQELYVARDEIGFIRKASKE